MLPPVPAFPPLPPSVPSPSTSRPIIKLKASQAAAEPEPKTVPKLPRGRKLKNPVPPSLPPLDVPPPPYVDDGSHDLLQEVLAVERQKDEEKLRHRVTTDKVSTNGVGKRKKADLSLDEEDDILALATPAKKERPSPPSASTSSEKVKVILPPPKVASGSHKAKKPPPLSAVDIPRISIKGKEREVSSPSVPPTPSRSKHSSVFQATPINDRKCKELLKVLQKLPEASIFLRPVDPVADGCPT